MAVNEEELFDILNEDGTKTGRTKPRKDVHRDGDLHGAAHIFVIRKKEGVAQVLLQKRSMTKDSFPGRYDTSSAGHLDAGDTFEEGARRELEEELGLSGRDPEFCFDFRNEYQTEFYGKPWHDNEIARVFLLTEEKEAEDFTFEEEEIECVEWFTVKEVLTGLRTGDRKYCIITKLFEQLIPYIEKKLDVFI